MERSPPSGPGEADSSAAGLPPVAASPAPPSAVAGMRDIQSNALSTSGVGNALYSGVTSSSASCALIASRSRSAGAGTPEACSMSPSYSGSARARRSNRVTSQPSRRAAASATPASWRLYEPARSLPEMINRRMGFKTAPGPRRGFGNESSRAGVTRQHREPRTRAAGFSWTP